MGVVTLRLNPEEEKILKILQIHLNEDKSRIIKHAMLDKYEDLQDLEVIANYEKSEKKKKVKFLSADSFVKGLERKRNKKAV